MRSILVAAVVAAVAVTAAFLSWPVRASADTQTFTSARYALIQGDINVGMLNPGAGDNVQNVLFKLDTTTGDVWALQMTVVSGNDPTVQGANWFKIANAGTFQPYTAGGAAGAGN